MATNTYSQNRYKEYLETNLHFSKANSSIWPASLDNSKEAKLPFEYEDGYAVSPNGRYACVKTEKRQFAVISQLRDKKPNVAKFTAKGDRIVFSPNSTIIFVIDGYNTVTMKHLTNTQEPRVFHIEKQEPAEDEIIESEEDLCNFDIGVAFCHPHLLNGNHFSFNYSVLNPEGMFIFKRKFVKGELNRIFYINFHGLFEPLKGHEKHPTIQEIRFLNEDSFYQHVQKEVFIDIINNHQLLLCTKNSEDSCNLHLMDIGLKKKYIKAAAPLLNLVLSNRRDLCLGLPINLNNSTTLHPDIYDCTAEDYLFKDQKQLLIFNLKKKTFISLQSEESIYQCSLQQRYLLLQNSSKISVYARTGSSFKLIYSSTADFNEAAISWNCQKLFVIKDKSVLITELDLMNAPLAEVYLPFEKIPQLDSESTKRTDSATMSVLYDKRFVVWAYPNEPVRRIDIKSTCGFSFDIVHAIIMSVKSNESIYFVAVSNVNNSSISVVDFEPMIGFDIKKTVTIPAASTYICCDNELLFVKSESDKIVAIKPSASRPARRSSSRSSAATSTPRSPPRISTIASQSAGKDICFCPHRSAAHWSTSSTRRYS